MTGSRLAGVLLAIVAATAVLPPAGAWAVNRHRVSRANREVGDLAQALAVRPTIVFRAGNGAVLLRGDGRSAQSAGPQSEGWVTTNTASLGSALGRDTLGADPWGNSYLVKVVGGTGVVLLSAGPNGLVETPFDTPGLTAGGDDITRTVTLRPIR